MKLNEIADTRPTLFVPIGPSGVGKSTLYRKLEQEYPGLQVFSLDILRHRFYDADDYRKAWYASTKDPLFSKKANEEFLQQIDQKKDLYVDNTNLTPRSRRFYIDEARRRGYKIVAFTFPNIDMATLIQRQQTRGDKFVPEDAVRNQFTKMEGPQENEFDETRTA